MFSRVATTLFRQIYIQKSPLNARHLTNATRCLQQQQQQPKPDQTSSSKASDMSATTKIRPSNLQKRILVFMGKYKSLDEVPEYVPNETMERVNSQFRIRLSNIMMVLTVVGCIVMVISGKRAAERGESVSKMNLDWHQQYNEGNKKIADTTTK